MKILYVQQHFASGQGEAGTRGYNLVRTLAGRGHEVTVICGRNWRDSSLATEKRQWVVEQDLDGFHVVQLGVFYSNHQSFPKRLWSFVLFGLLACYQVLRRRADLIYASSTPLTMSIPALCARCLKGTPYVFEVRDLWPDFPIELGIIRNPLLKRALYFWERITYRFAWRLVALAPGIKDEIERKAGVVPARVAMVPNGSDTEHLLALGRLPRNLIPIAEDKLALGYCGTHGRANGLDAVLDAAAVLKHRGASDVVFVLIGDGREKARLMRRAEEEGLDNVWFAGLFNKASYNQVLAELDVGMQTLLNIRGFYYGTSPNKFFDYLSVGKPVLVNYPGWMSDLVTEHGCGVTVPPDDAEAFADAVESLNADRQRLEAMGRAARSLAESQFSQQRILVELAEFIEAKEPLQLQTMTAIAGAGSGRG
ncbi:MAG: glycosyltransferase family 4 protein [Pyrinomonadaceae bacterium]